MLRSYVAGLLLIGLVACGQTSVPSTPNETSNQSDAPSLDNTTWTLSTLFGEPVIEGVTHPEKGIDNPAVVVKFKTGTLEGYGGCETYDGGYEYTDTDFTLRTLSYYHRPCPDAVVTQEHAYFEALGNSVFTYGIEDDKLTFYDGIGGVTMEFTR